MANLKIVHSIKIVTFISCLTCKHLTWLPHATSALLLYINNKLLYYQNTFVYHEHFKRFVKILIIKKVEWCESTVTL